MWSHLAIFFLGCFSLSAALTDLTYVCKDKSIGVAVPNPLDCKSYFICDVLVPTLTFCDGGLHFDAKRQVCNWPAEAKCEIAERAPANNDDDTDIKSQSFAAFDVDTGLRTDPLTKYDPQDVACHHFGAYFLPHPRNCRKYYVCAFGHLLKHGCGRGTHWNFKRQECEPVNQAECYSSIANAAGHEVAEPVPVDAIVYPYTACYLYVDDNSAPIPITTATTTDSTWQPTGSYHTATTDTWHTTHTTPTWHTTDGTWTNPPSTGTTLLSTSRADDLALDCPKERQAYLPHATDCSKYYICIVGSPVMTSCPEGYYWDQNEELCDLARNVKCAQK